MNMASMELELVPQDENIAKARKTRKSKNSQDAPAPTSTKFHPVDPFNNALDLIKFYRSVIKSQDPSAKFYNSISETSDAQLILDALIKAGKSNNFKFLKMWILNHYSIALKGNNIYKPEKTAMKEFLKTFSSFNTNYYG